MQATLLQRQLVRVFDSFSIVELLLTLFAPFRQISAGRVRGPVGVRLRAWGDRLVSRFIGAFVRLILVCIGLVWVLLLAAFGLVRLLLWPLIPLFPVIGILLFMMGTRL